ncbi:unnamed protein product (mitochondrion) [Plasmodiophora brassicae]|uniref:Uncharacterized protein n=1 Tax=Plasmodiophora brassicae TaxID=37360 RepID=A0A3P3YHN1_PLABS|nr:unnamed protein product [Plasmodiophora brassicae]
MPIISYGSDHASAEALKMHVTVPMTLNATCPLSILMSGKPFRPMLTNGMSSVLKHLFHRVTRRGSQHWHQVCSSFRDASDRFLKWTRLLHVQRYSSLLEHVCQTTTIERMSGMQEVLGDLLYLAALLWIDDVLGYVRDLAEYFVILEHILKRFHGYVVMLNPNRCHLWLRKVTWCGRVISAEGISFDESMINALKTMATPNMNAADLQQFLCALTWMRTSVPRFSERVHPLQQLLLESSRKIRSLKKLF